MAQRMFCDKCQEEIRSGEKHVWVSMEVHDERKSSYKAASIREYHPPCWDELGAEVKA